MSREGFACPNPLCMCKECTCGEGCTCGVSTDVTCDPCADFKKAKMAAAACAAVASKRIRLVYFPVRARAEAIRMCLAHGRIEYSDETVESYFGKPWPEAKAEVPFGQLPLLVVDGAVIAQSGACVRYVAGLAGLVPADPLRAALCDSVFEAAQELVSCNPIVNVFRGEQFAQKKAEFFETFPTKLANLARLLEPGPFFLGAAPHYCDFAVYHQFDLARLLEPAVFDGLPAVQRFMGAVEALPGVGEYLARRPECVGIGSEPRLAPKAAGSA